MVGIPPAVDTDVEDVVWALQTAASLWSKDERVDAIVWLRRAAQAAGEAEHDERALLLAREAAELSEWIAKNPVQVSSTFPAVTPSDVAGHGVDDLLGAPPSQSEIPIEVGDKVSMSAMTEPHAFMPVNAPQIEHMPEKAPEKAPEKTAMVFQSLAREPDSGKVRSAEEAHAGLLDPWAAPEEDIPAPPISTPGAQQTVVSSEDYDDEVVTSARLETRNLPPAEPAMVMAVPPLPPLVPTPPKIQFPVEQTLVSAGVVPHSKPVDLSAALALADLPDDARGELERGAKVHHLARDEEVMGFALAYVIDGDIDVAAQIVDAPAERISKGKVLKAKGTVAESVPLRLICASDDAVVATWDAEQIEPAFKTCPWVEDDLRASANRMQALVGVTLGPLAERLDAALRAQVTSKLELRELAEGDVLVEAGEPVRDLCLIGQGSVELVTNGEVTGAVGIGEFLFPTEIMSGGKAVATARAGKGGALILAGSLGVAQELMSTCPPLLEIFAGM
jgi:hypothetical protein